MRWHEVWYGATQMWLKIPLACVVLAVAGGCTIFDAGGQARKVTLNRTEYDYDSEGGFKGLINGTHNGFIFLAEFKEDGGTVNYEVIDGKLIPVSMEGVVSTLMSDTDAADAVKVGDSSFANSAQMFGELNTTVRHALDKIPDGGSANAPPTDPDIP